MHRLFKACFDIGCILIVFDTKSINCDTVKTFLCVAVSRSNNGWLLGFAPAEYFAFHGHGLSLLRSKERFFRGLRTRAIPIGVYVFCLRWGCFLMRLVTAHIINVSLSSSTQKESYSKLRKKCETPRKYKPIFFVRCNAAEAFPVEIECFFRNVRLALHFKRMGRIQVKVTS